MSIRMLLYVQPHHLWDSLLLITFTYPTFCGCGIFLATTTLVSASERSLSFLHVFFCSCSSPCNEICKNTQLQLPAFGAMWSQYIKLQKFCSCQWECPWSGPGILLCFSWCPAFMSKHDIVSVLLSSFLSCPPSFLMSHELSTRMESTQLEANHCGSIC